MTAPSNSDREDFAAFCRGATTPQLHVIIRKETHANRRVYADIARYELEKR